MTLDGSRDMELGQSMAKIAESCLTVHVSGIEGRALHAHFLFPTTSLMICGWVTVVTGSKKGNKNCLHFHFYWLFLYLLFTFFFVVNEIVFLIVYEKIFCANL